MVAKNDETTNTELTLPSTEGELVKSPKKKKSKRKKRTSTSTRQKQLRDLTLRDSLRPRQKNIEEDSNNSESTLIDVNQYPAHLDIIDMMGTVSKLEPKSPKLKMGRRKSLIGLDGEEKTKKRVTFKCNKKGKIKPRIREYERDDPLDIWWTNEELNSFREQCLEVVAHFQKQDDYVSALETLYRAHLPVTTESSIDEATHLLAVHEKARGLEMHIGGKAYPIMQEHQATLVALAEDYASSSTLRKESRAISKPCRVFATAMAQYDAEEAAVVYTC